MREGELPRPPVFHDPHPLLVFEVLDPRRDLGDDVGAFPPDHGGARGGLGFLEPFWGAVPALVEGNAVIVVAAPILALLPFRQAEPAHFIEQRTGHCTHLELGVSPDVGPQTGEGAWAGALRAF